MIAYDIQDYPMLEKHLTPERIKRHFSGVVQGEVVRYARPHLGVLNFVMRQALGGGVTRSLALDAHGKSLNGAMLGMVISEREEPECRKFQKKKEYADQYVISTIIRNDAHGSYH